MIAQVVDPINDRIYAAIGPTGDLYRYDIASGEGTLLGHPDYGRAYVYAGRAMWLDREGRGLLHRRERRARLLWRALRSRHLECLHL